MLLAQVCMYLCMCVACTRRATFIYRARWHCNAMQMCCCAMHAQNIIKYGRYQIYYRFPNGDTGCIRALPSITQHKHTQILSKLKIVLRNDEHPYLSSCFILVYLWPCIYIFVSEQRHRCALVVNDDGDSSSRAVTTQNGLILIPKTVFMRKVRPNVCLCKAANSASLFWTVELWNHGHGIMCLNGRSRLWSWGWKSTFFLIHIDFSSFPNIISKSNYLSYARHGRLPFHTHCFHIYT